MGVLSDVVGRNKRKRKEKEVILPFGEAERFGSIRETRSVALGRALNTIIKTQQDQPQPTQAGRQAGRQTDSKCKLH